VRYPVLHFQGPLIHTANRSQDNAKYTNPVIAVFFWLKLNLVDDVYLLTEVGDGSRTAEQLSH